jgi:hypothetical protein
MKTLLASPSFNSKVSSSIRLQKIQISALSTDQRGSSARSSAGRLGREAISREETSRRLMFGRKSLREEKYQAQKDDPLSRRTLFTRSLHL